MQQHRTLNVCSNKNCAIYLIYTFFSGFPLLDFDPIYSFMCYAKWRFIKFGVKWRSIYVERVATNKISFLKNGALYVYSCSLKKYLYSVIHISVSVSFFLLPEKFRLMLKIIIFIMIIIRTYLPLNIWSKKLSSSRELAIRDDIFSKTAPMTL